jgi:Ca-activated chloride channel family protein
MVGIGSAPNTYLMRRMAEAGRGTYTNIGNGTEVTTKMQALLDRLKAPAVRGLSVRVNGATLDFTPARLPDLYAGEPLVLLGKGDAAKGTLTVTGKIGDKDWSRTVDLAQASESPAIARLWASHRIADIEAQRWSGQIEDEAADTAIADLGLAYSLVTTQTSLIAEDKTPSRPAGARLTREELPLLLPAGWDFDTLLGTDGQSAEQPSETLGSDQATALDLPQTATGYAEALLRGLIIAALGLAGLILTRRCTKEYTA